MRSYQNSQNTNLTNSNTGAVAQFVGEPDIQSIIGGAYIGLLDSAGAIGGSMQNVAQATMNRMVFRDNPRISQTLQSLNVTDSIKEVIRQMKIQGATVLAHTITATPTSFTGRGNGVIVTSVRRPSDGIVLEQAFTETLLLVCTGDSYLGGASAGNESFQITGTGKQSNVFAFDWPLGSDARASASAIDGSANNSRGNLLTNSGFDTFTGNTPGNFTIVVGTVGTHIFAESSLTFGGTKALRLTGDGTTLVELSQQFGISTGTSATIEPLTQYGFNIWARRDGTAAAAGSLLTIDLVDGNNTVIQDANGISNTFNIDLAALTMVYAAYNAAFRTPHVLPSTIKWRLRFPTGGALSDGRSIYLDLASMGKMISTYTGGPHLSIHSGSTNFSQGDYATVALSNSRGSGGTLNTFQTSVDRLLGLRELGLILPSSSSPTISDTDLIA